MNWCAKGQSSLLSSRQRLPWNSACFQACRVREAFKGVFGTVPVFSVPVWMSYQTYRSVWCRYWCTELTEVSGTGIDVVPNLPKCPVPVSISYRTYRVVRYRYWCTELNDESDSDIDVPNLPKCLVPVFMSYRTYRSVRYRYWCRTELTEVSGTDIDVVPN